MLFAAGIIDASKQLNPANSPECVFELYYVGERRTQQLEGSKVLLDTFIRVWALYILFIIINSTYDMLYWVIHRGAYNKQVTYLYNSENSKGNDARE